MTNDEAAKLRGVLRAIRKHEASANSIRERTRGLEQERYAGQWIGASICGDKLERAFPEVFTQEAEYDER